ncbi:Alpha/Beta hydrolase protein [Lasiosphaeria miniovina]|uniref:Alpha/Beta hydrolase protein n=1 Tax=Lasiosphaeria miniovina TaxID=1954250 RepID=A0AA40AWQ7_9PEZI|nr:Alpha/Beta hydrolase protein [Lasiosphaeria miniovina]KAK0723360.1 Alpha/Beta hydrolase protein [Lasiosphaeria miniovina]
MLPTIIRRDRLPAQVPKLPIGCREKQREEKMNSAQAQPQAPGRLGDPSMHLATDPRTHPKLLEKLRADKIEGTPTFVAALSPDAPLGEIASFTRRVEDYLEEYYKKIDLAPVPGEGSYEPVIRSEWRIPCDDSREIRLVVHRPDPTAAPAATLPAVIYLHGGAMVMLSSTNPLHTSWASALARTGLIVISPDFRNVLSSSTDKRLHPFPAGLDDCVVAVRWVAAHRRELGIGADDKIVLQGESGGGNLALATALRANRERWLAGAIDGVCAWVPYISGAYGAPREWKLRQGLASLVECDGYIMSCPNSTLNARLYDPEGSHTRDPLAWPYWAAEKDLQGLPPHLIITSELDLLRDEGNAYFRKLVAAGVRAVGRMNLGITHMGELSYRHAVPEIYLDNLWAVRSFISWL